MSNINNHYWNAFYSQESLTRQPSSFAKFSVPYIDKDKALIELGCGNGRDALFFSDNGIKVFAFDISEEVIKINKRLNNSNVSYICHDFTQISDSFTKDINIGTVYSRFTMHAIEKIEMLRTFKWAYQALPANGRFFIEARTINDPLYGIGEKLQDNAYFNTHYRRFLNIREIIDNLQELGFIIQHCVEDYISAWYKDDKAVVLRIIAEK